MTTVVHANTIVNHSQSHQPFEVLGLSEIDA